MDKERLASLRELEDLLGYRFERIEWLDQALTHKSFTNQTHPPQKESNEVLEFLGDAVLNLIVSHLLLRAFPKADEGILSMRRAHLVKQSSLAHFSKEIRLEDFLLLGKGELLDGGRKKSSILANAYEAIVGAIFMDSGYDRTLEVLAQRLRPYIHSEDPSFLFRDYKSLLQREAQRIYGKSPQYRVLKEFGPDHDKRFEASVTIDGETKGVGRGKSKKEAEQEAARNALDWLERSNPEVQRSTQT